MLIAGRFWPPTTCCFAFCEDLEFRGRQRDEGLQRAVEQSERTRIAVNISQEEFTEDDGIVPNNLREKGKGRPADLWKDVGRPGQDSNSQRISRSEIGMAPHPLETQGMWGTGSVEKVTFGSNSNTVSESYDLLSPTSLQMMLGRC